MLFDLSDSKPRCHVTLRSSCFMYINHTKYHLRVVTNEPPIEFSIPIMNAICQLSLIRQIVPKESVTVCYDKIRVDNVN